MEKERIQGFQGSSENSRKVRFQGYHFEMT